MMQSSSARIDWPSIGQLGVGALSCLICFLLAGGLILLVNNPFLFGNDLGAEAQGLLMLAGFLAAVGLLNVPSIILSWRALNGRPFVSTSQTNP